MNRFVVVTNIPSPYRVYFFDELYKKIGDTFHVLYCARNESNRQWDVPSIHHPHIFLKTKNVRYNLYWKSNIWSTLSNIKPEAIVTAGFTPVMLKAFLYAKIYGLKHIVFTDSWKLTVDALSIWHKLIRKIVFKKTHSFICIGAKGKEFLESFGCQKEKIYISPIVIDNSEYFQCNKNVEKKYDIVFSGQFIERKMPMFFCQVLVMLQKHIPSLKVLLLGSGLLLEKTQTILGQHNIEYNCPGFIQPRLLPSWYVSCKLMLFPTLMDHWGVVANEACAAALPVITTNESGAADDLIINKFNGYVLEPVPEKWCTKTKELLEDNIKREKFAANSLKQASKYNKNIAISKFMEAINN